MTDTQIEGFVVRLAFVAPAAGYTAIPLLKLLDAPDDIVARSSLSQDIKNRSNGNGA